MSREKIYSILAIIGAAICLAAELYATLPHPPPPEHPFPAGTHLIHVFNVGDGNQAQGKANITDGNVTWQWRGWNDTWLWIDQQPKQLVQHDQIFPRVLEPNERMQINYFGWWEHEVENVTYWINYSLSYYVYCNGEKGLGPWHMEAEGHY